MSVVRKTHQPCRVDDFTVVFSALMVDNPQKAVLNGWVICIHEIEET